MHWDVLEVQVVGELEMAVRFADGLMGRVKFEPSYLYGVFAQLNNPDVFSRVDVSEGFVRWPGDIDLAPDAMYQAIKRDGVWVLRAALNNSSSPRRRGSRLLIPLGSRLRGNDEPE